MDSFRFPAYFNKRQQRKENKHERTDWFFLTVSFFFPYSPFLFVYFILFVYFCKLANIWEKAEHFDRTWLTDTKYPGFLLLLLL